MTEGELNQRAAQQHKRNIDRFGDQPMGLLVLETEDQVAKLRDALLHRTLEQVERRVINIISLMYAIGDKLPHTVNTKAKDCQELRLGPRLVTVGGKPIGTCDDLSLIIADATEAEIEELRGAKEISLVRTIRGEKAAPA